jgi:hypothetical protein
VLAAFAPLFTHPSWRRAQALLCGVLLAPANHTLTAALRALGLAREPGFQNYHRLLNRARWSARHAAQVLLRLLVEAFVPSGPVKSRPGRNHRTPPRAQAHGPGHLLRCGPLQQGLFPEDQRLTLDDGGVVGAGALDGAGLGVAVSDGALSFRTLRPLPAAGPAAQTARRACARSARPSAPLAAGSRAHRGGR